MSRHTTENYIKVSAKALEAVRLKRISQGAFCFYCYLLSIERKSGTNSYSREDGTVCDCWFYKTSRELSRGLECSIEAVRNWKRELEAVGLIETYRGTEPPETEGYRDENTLKSSTTWYKITD
ncbi:MAG: hypothetical protein LUH03_03750 [Oscillospiraceae bacterium]|nr:hypothetical protein [Oscillospiraceae bacterium]